MSSSRPTWFPRWLFSVRAVMILLISLATIFPLGIILYQGLQHRAQAYRDSRILSERVATEVVFDQQILLSSAEQLVSTFSYIPAIRRRDAIAANALLADLVRKNPQITNLLVADEKGITWASGLPMKEAINASDRQYFRNAMETGRFSSGEYSIGRLLNRPTLLFGYPLRDGSGRITDVATVSFSLDKYERYFQTKTKGLATDVSLGLFDRKGTVLFSRPTLALIGRQDREDLFRKMATGPDEGSFEAVGLTGVNRVFTYRKLRLPGESQPYMYVRAGISVSSILARTEKDFLFGMGSVAAAAILILLASVLLSKRFVLDKVAALREATERISRGDLSARVPEIVLGGDLGELGKAFDNMARRLQEADTERQGAVKELRESETRYHSIFNYGADGIVIVDPDTATLIDFNQQACTQLGYTREEFGGLKISDIDLLESPEKVKARIQGVIDTGYDEFETVHRTKQGERRNVHVKAQNILVGGKSVYHCIWRDITDRKRAEEELRRSEDRFAIVFRASPVCTSLTRLSDGHFLDVNDAFVRLLGYGREEVIGRNPLMLNMWANPDDRARMVGILRERGRIDNLETAFRTKSGEIRNVIVISEVIDVGGEQYILGLSLDITDAKRAEAEKEKLQAQLQQAMKMEAVGRLAGGVAHDFNNLLTVITGYSELLLLKIGKESPMRGEVEEIRRAGERAASLTQQLLAFSRKQIIEPRVVQLDSLVAEMHKMLTRLIGEDIALQAITGKSPGSVKVDPGQFQQILMNLVVNARDAMPGGGKIVIETANVDLDEGYCASHPYVKPGRFVMLSVSDTGKGMSDEVKAHVFEPFFTTKERGSGTGLGLATAFGAVKQAGGSIEVYSEVGIGTTIRIYLPRVDEEAANPVKDDRPTEAPGGTETVLIVEDEGTLRDLCVRILEQLGYKVLQARNGAEAIAEAQKYGDRIDLLLTDVVMPGMNGAELATQLALHHPEMKVLFTSGYTEDVITHRGVLADGVSFIGKPYTPKALARKVREVLDR